MSEGQFISETERRRLRPYPKYKDSGVEWLSEIPSHWDVKPFKALLSRNDSGVWGEDFADDGVIVLRSTEQTVDGKWNIENPARRRLTTREAFDARLKVGDLVVTKSSGSELHIGKTSIVDLSVAALNCCFSNFMQRLRVAWPNLSRHYWYLLNCPVAREQLIFLSSTTTGLGNLNGSILGSIRVPVAPDDEQRAIAAFLNRETAKIDALIEKKERLIELLQEKRTALITHAVTKGLDPNVPMKDSGVEWLGEIPANWEVKPFTKYTVEKSDYRGKTPVKVASGVFLVTARNVRMGLIDYECSQEFVAEDEYDIIMRRGLPRKGDILFTTEAPLGNVAMVDREDIALAQRIIRFRMNGKYLDNRFTLYAMMSGCFHTQLLSLSTGSTAEGLKASKLPMLRIATPSLAEQSGIVALLNRETAKIEVLVAGISEAIDRLQEYRTALISAAVTGKIDVRDIA
jgi:type I restriction enzyme S subunit